MLPILLTLSISTLYIINIVTPAITSFQLIKDSETITSNDDTFKLGFFSPPNTTNRYVGIWYLTDSNIIWVANREKPLEDSSGVVTISNDDNTNLVILNKQKHVIWSSNISTNFLSSNFNVTVQLRNTGNLVLSDNTTGNIIWESFKHPSDVFLPNLIISTNHITGEKVKITSWKSPSDPAIGKFSGSLERLIAPEIFVWNQTKPYWRSGPWNGQVFIGLPSNLLSTSAYLNGYSISREDNGSVVELIYTLQNSSFFGTIMVSSEGKLVYTAWINKHQVGKLVVQENECDVYGFCGPNGSCDIKNSIICTCLNGFKPRNLDEWNRRNWTSGCVRRGLLQCERVNNNGSELDDFSKLVMTKVPDFVKQSYLSVDACKIQCLNNCNCSAYAFDDGIRCLTWSGKLIDIVRYSSGGIDLYIRQPYSELDKGEKRNVTAIVIGTVIVGAIIVATCTYFFLCSRASKRSGRRKEMLMLKRRQTHEENRNASLIGDVKQVKIEDLPLFDFNKISTATNNFGSANKIGQGGFGSVYKGELPDGLEIAVKRLSRASGQGIEEFMNEIIVISKLLTSQSYPINKKILDWQKRLYIIEGISRGLLYLHRDSRLKIIHNPKISDFGMARIFGSSENEANTRRIVGTYGYMSPKYAMEGLFSEKSDVFSFGVLLLEIISSRKNTSFYNHEALSLLGYAWKLWNEEEIECLIDPEICSANYVDHILRCIHIGLLCVQEFAKERPSMATVVSMFNSEIVKFPRPFQPAFIQQRQTEHRGDSAQQIHNLNSTNIVTITTLQGR